MYTGSGKKYVAHQTTLNKNKCKMGNNENELNNNNKKLNDARSNASK